MEAPVVRPSYHKSRCEEQAPSLRATAIHITMLVSLRSTEAIAAAWSQSPEWGSEATLSLARSISVPALMVYIAVLTIGASQALWMCCVGVRGVIDENWLHQEASIMTLVIFMIVMWEDGRIYCCSSSVDAADAKKAEVSAFPHSSSQCHNCSQRMILAATGSHEVQYYESTIAHTSAYCQTFVIEGDSDSLKFSRCTPTVAR